MSCRNRTVSSGVANIDLESTEGFSELSKEVQSNTLAVQNFMNKALRNSGIQVFNVSNEQVTWEQYKKYDGEDKSSHFYFKFKNLGLDNMGMQFFPRVDADTRKLTVKVQSIDTSNNSQVIVGSQQLITFDTNKINGLLNENPPISCA